MNINLKLIDLKKMNWPSGQFVVVGSGPLAIRGIREAKDLDVVVTEALWDELLKDHPIKVNAWNIETMEVGDDIEILNPAQSSFGNSKVVPRKEIFNSADMFDGIKFINLDCLKRIKAKMGRESDLRDIKLINAYIQNEKFIDSLKKRGYDKVYIWDAEPGEVDEEHEHDFDTKLLIISGEIKIRSGKKNLMLNMSYKKGGEVDIPRHTPHEAKVGPEGCLYIVGEKH